MKKKVETTFLDQSRWDHDYGTASLEILEKNPDEFIVSTSKFSRAKLDLIQAMGDIRGKKILDFGCGRGEFSIALAKMGAIVTGIDIGSDLIELSRQVAELNGVSCDFVVGSIHELPFEDGSFDFVVGNDILHHLPQQGVADSVKEAYRVLGPGGKALFTEPMENSKAFDFLQNLIPVGEPGTSRYRPSILQRAKFKKFLEEVDDRQLSQAELVKAKGGFRKAEFSYYGLLIRLQRLFPAPAVRKALLSIDKVLTHNYSPFKILGQKGLIIYTK